MLTLTFAFVACRGQVIIKPPFKKAIETTSQEKNYPTTSGEIKKKEAISQLSEADILQSLGELIKEDTKPAGIMEFMDKNIVSVSRNTAAKMMEKIEVYQKRYEQYYKNYLFEQKLQDELNKLFRGDIERSEIEGLTDIEVKSLLLEIYNGGFRLVSLEGSYYPVISYEFLKKYSGWLTEEFADYLEVMAAESNKTYKKDAGIVTGWDEIEQRIINSEKYLISYPDNTIRRMNIANLYMGYLKSYLFGEDNTPCYDIDTHKVYDNILDSYKNITRQYPHLQSASICMDYLELLKENNYMFSDNMSAKIEDYLKRPIEYYSLDNPGLMIHQVKNMYYTSDLSTFGYILLIDGIYREQYDDEIKTELFIVTDDNYISIEDINKDGINDAAIILAACTGGSANFYYLHAVINKYYYLYDAAADILGDRVQIKDLDICEGKIIIDMVTHREEDPLCCPTKEILQEYLYNDNQLFRIISNTGIIDKIAGDAITVLVDDSEILKIIIGNYQIPNGIARDDMVYIEYYYDSIAEQYYIYNIESLDG